MADKTIIAEGLWGAGLTAEELAQMQQIPSSFANRVYVRPYGGMVRISWGEMIEGATNWHSAVAVSAEDLIVMAELFLTQARGAIEWRALQSASAPPEAGNAE